MPASITIGTIGTQIAGVPFSIAGTYTYSAATWTDTLNYGDDAGPVEGTVPVIVPLNASSWSQVHPGLPAGTHTLRVLDAATGLEVVSNPFLVVPAQIITPASPIGTITGVGYSFTGSLTGYVSPPSLTFSIDGATPQALTGVTSSGWSMLLSGPAAGNHTVVVTDGIVSGSTTFVTAAPAKIIKPTTPTGVIAGQSFTFSGTLTNYPSAPALTYTLDGGPVQQVLNETQTSWSMPLTIATAGTHTIIVSDGTTNGTTGAFTVSAAPLVITPNAPVGTVAAVAFTFTGSLSGYLAVPSLTYTIDAGSPVAMTGVIISGWSMQITAPASGSHTITVTDGTITGGPVSFTTAAAPKVITPNSPAGTIAGVAFTFTGSLTNYGSTPSLTYSIDGATPVAMTGVSSTAWSMSITAPAAGFHTIVVSDATITGSTTFTTSATTQTIHPNAPTGTVAGSPFTFTGSLAGYTSIPSLTYSVDGGTPIALSGVTLTGWSASISVATSGSHTITVSDGSNNGAATFSTAAPVRTIVPVPPGTVVTGATFNFTGALTGYSAASSIVLNNSGGSFTDRTGGVWTCVGGTVQLNGVNAGFTSQVTEIALVGTGAAQTIWQVNVTPSWFSTPPGVAPASVVWTAGTNPLANDTTPLLSYSIDGGSAVTMTGVTATGWATGVLGPAVGSHTIQVTDGTISSAVIPFTTIVSTSITIIDARFQNPPQSFTDNQGVSWHISVNARMVANGVEDMTTGQVTHSTYAGGVIYHRNFTGNWFSKPNAAGSWTATTNPLPLGNNGPQLQTSIATRSADHLSIWGYGLQIDQGGLSNASILATEAAYLNTTLFRQQAGFSSANVQAFVAAYPKVRFEVNTMLAYSWDFNGSGQGGTANNVTFNINNFLSDIGGSSRIFGIEGQNEVNGFDAAGGLSGWQAGLVGNTNAMRAISTLATVPILNLTFANSFLQANLNIQAQMGDETTIGVNWSNAHSYNNDGGGGGAPQLGHQFGIEVFENVQAISTPGRPGAMTEWGYGYGNAGQNGQHVTGPAGAKMTVGGFLDAWYVGLAGSFFFELNDGTGEGFYLFDGSGNPNPLATGIHNFTSYVLDTGTTARTFTPGTLDFTLSFSGSGTPPFCTVLSWADGTKFIVLWNNDIVQTTGANPSDVTPPAANALVTFSASHAVHAYDYITNTETNLGTISSTTVVVQGYAKILKVV